MHRNEETIKEKWSDFKGELQKSWSKLTNEELEKTKGSIKALSHLIKERYKDSKADVLSELNTLAAKFGNEKAAAKATKGIRSTKTVKRGRH